MGYDAGSRVKQFILPQKLLEGESGASLYRVSAGWLNGGFVALTPSSLKAITYFWYSIVGDKTELALFSTKYLCFKLYISP